MTSTEDETTKTRKDENIASEMEAAGLTSHIPTLIIRGVCDYADSTKNRLWQKYFAQTAKELVELTANIHGIDNLPQHSDLTAHVSSSTAGASGNSSLSMPGLNSRSEVYQEAIVYLINHFATDAELLALYGEAVQQMNEASFISNHQYLLKIYYLELEFKNQDPSQRQTILLLRKRRERHFLSHQVYHAVKSTDTHNQERKRILLDQEENQLRLLNMLLERNTSNSAASRNVIDTLTDTEWYTEDEGSDSDADTTDSCLELSELKSRARFLCKGRPYNQYKEQLRELVFRKAKNQAKKSHLEAIQAQPEVELPDILDNTKPKWPTLPEKTESQPINRWHVLDKTVKPLQHILFSPSRQLCHRFLSLKRWLRPKLKVGYHRIEWQCDCGVHLYADFPPGDSEPINNLARTLQNGGGSQIGLRANNGNNAVSSTDIPWSTSHSNPQSQISAAQNTDQQPPPGFIRRKFLALCVNTGSIYKTLVEIDASEITSDATAFLRMKERYLKTRRRLSRLNFLVKPVTVEFVQFTLWNLRGGYISVCDRPDRIPPDDSSDCEYIPKPLEPPIPMPPEVFIHYLEHDEGDLSHARDTWINRLPKRLYRRVIDGGEGTYGWGIHIIEGPNREIIFWLIMITIFGSLLASILWTVFHKDIQGGTGLGTMIVALPPAVLTAFLFRIGAI